MRTGTTARAVRHDGTAFTLALSDGTEVTGAALLVATGRRTDLAGIGAGVLGVDENARALPVDDHLRVAPGCGPSATSPATARSPTCPCTRPTSPCTTSSASTVSPAEYHAVPRVTFTDPEIGSVGLTEAQARDRGLDVRTSCYPVPDSARGWIHKAGNDGFIKLVADAGRASWSGPARPGPPGGEVLSMLTLAVHARVPVRRLREMIYAYPTFHRAIEPALQELALQELALQEPALQEPGPSGAGAFRSRALTNWPVRRWTEAGPRAVPGEAGQRQADQADRAGAQQPA